MNKRNRGSYGYPIFIVILALIPLITRSPYHLQVLITIYTYGIAALGARLILSTGQWCFGMAAFMSMGAYVSPLLVMNFGINFWLGLLCAGLVVALVGFLIGYPALRLRGAYFGIMTLLFNMVIRQVIIIMPGITGGKPGLR